MAVEVVIIGAGYAGVVAANRLAGAPGNPVHVTIVNPRAEFTKRIRLHQVAAGSASAEHEPLSAFLNPAASVIVGEATAIDPAKRTVALRNHPALGYDYLVYAAGSDRSTAPPGAFSVTNAESAAALRAHLPTLNPGSVVDVIGAGLTGIETAGEIAERYPHLAVRLSTSGQVGPGLSDHGRRRIRASLDRLGVQILDGGAPVPEAASPEVTRVWCAGFAVGNLAQASGLAVDGDARLLVAPHLGAVGHERIFGAGDAATIADEAYAFERMGCALAMPMGAHAADGILRLTRGQSPLPFNHGYLAQCMSVGRRAGLVQFVGRDDAAWAIAAGGRLGAWGKEGISRMSEQWLRGEARRSGSYSWPAGPRALATRPVAANR